MRLSLIIHCQQRAITREIIPNTSAGNTLNGEVSYKEIEPDELREGDLISLSQADAVITEIDDDQIAVTLEEGSEINIDWVPQYVARRAINRLARSARELASFASYADPLLSHTEIVS